MNLLILLVAFTGFTHPISDGKRDPVFIINHINGARHTNQANACKVL